MKIRVLTTCALACLAALPAMPGAARTQPPSYGGYVVAVDKATMGEKGWKKVVDALRIAMSCGTDSLASSAQERICCALRSCTTNTPVG